MHDEDGVLLYIGCTRNLAQRIERHSASDGAWITDVASIRVEWFATAADAADAETTAIALERPRYNRPGAARYSGRTWQSPGNRVTIEQRGELNVGLFAANRTGCDRYGIGELAAALGVSKQAVHRRGAAGKQAAAGARLGGQDLAAARAAVLAQLRLPDTAQQTLAGKRAASANGSH